MFDKFEDLKRLTEMRDKGDVTPEDSKGSRLNCPRSPLEERQRWPLLTLLPVRS